MIRGSREAFRANVNLEIAETDDRRQEIIYEIEDHGDVNAANIKAGYAGTESTLGADIRGETQTILDEFTSGANSEIKSMNSWLDKLE